MKFSDIIQWNCQILSVGSIFIYKGVVFVAVCMLRYDSSENFINEE